jgi:hypothetical protein
MRRSILVVLTGLALTPLGCGSGSKTLSTKELNDAQAQSQKQADDDERRHAQEGRGKK